MQLSDNWKYLHKAYSVIFSVLGVALSLVEVVLPHFGLLQPFLDPATYGLIMFCLTAGAAVGRYIKQDIADGKFDGKREEEVGVKDA